MIPRISQLVIHQKCFPIFEKSRLFGINPRHNILVCEYLVLSNRVNKNWTKSGMRKQSRREVLEFGPSLVPSDFSIEIQSFLFARTFERIWNISCQENRFLKIFLFHFLFISYIHIYFFFFFFFRRVTYHLVPRLQYTRCNIVKSLTAYAHACRGWTWMDWRLV